MQITDILLYDNSEYTPKQIVKILKKAKPTSILDHVLPENVHVWQRFEYIFTVREFINEVQI